MKVDHLLFEVRAILGGVEIPNFPLQLGDILILDQKVGDPLPVRIEDEILFLATPGLLGINKAVRVDERVHT